MENEDRQVVAGTGSMEEAMGEVLLIDERNMESETNITRATPLKGKFWTQPEEEEDPAVSSAVIRSQREDRASVTIGNIMAPEESGRLTRGRMAALLAAGEIPDSQEQEEEKEGGAQKTLISESEMDVREERHPRLEAGMAEPDRPTNGNDDTWICHPTPPGQTNQTHTRMPAKIFAASTRKRRRMSVGSGAGRSPSPGVGRKWWDRMEAMIFGIREEARTEMTMRNADRQALKALFLQTQKAVDTVRTTIGREDVMTKILEDVKFEVRDVNTHCGVMAELAQRTLDNTEGIAKVARSARSLRAGGRYPKVPDGNDGVQISGKCASQ